MHFNSMFNTVLGFYTATLIIVQYINLLILIITQTHVSVLVFSPLLPFP